MKFEVSTSIDADSDAVFDFLSNFENNPRWQSGVVEATKTTAGEVGVGTRFQQVSSFLGKRIETRFEVTELQPGERIRYESTEGTFPIHITRAVEPGPNGTVVHATIEGEPSGVFSIAAPLLERLAKHRIQGDYRTVQTLFESGEA